MKAIDKYNEELRRRLESLSPKARLRLVVSFFVVFAVCSIFQIVAAVANFGKGRTTTEIGHIESVSLSKEDGQGVSNLLKDIEEWKRKK